LGGGGGGGELVWVGWVVVGTLSFPHERDAQRPSPPKEHNPLHSTSPRKGELLCSIIVKRGSNRGGCTAAAEQEGAKSGILLVGGVKKKVRTQKGGGVEKEKRKTEGASGHLSERKENPIITINA